jgi:predicted phosphoadenosine phosphosulfate sulfurtransferase
MRNSYVSKTFAVIQKQIQQAYANFLHHQITPKLQENSLNSHKAMPGYARLCKAMHKAMLETCANLCKAMQGCTERCKTFKKNPQTIPKLE